MTEIERDRYDRPLILPPGGKKKIPYTRVSTLSKTIADQGALIDWKGRMVAAGLSLSSDLWWESTEILGKYGPDPQFRDGKSAWNDLAEKAGVLAGVGQWAEVGTEIHGQIEKCIRRGLRLGEGEWSDYVEVFFHVVERRYEILDTEVFVVNDQLQAAGTLDLLLRNRVTKEVLVGDLKTGAHDHRYPIPVTTQVAVYADSVRYDPNTEQRSPIWADSPVNLELGVLVHLPAKKSPPECKLYPLDLDLGNEMALSSVAVREFRKMKPLTPFTDGDA